MVLPSPNCGPKLCIQWRWKSNLGYGTTCSSANQWSLEILRAYAKRNALYLPCGLNNDLKRALKQFVHGANRRWSIGAVWVTGNTIPAIHWMVQGAGPGPGPGPGQRGNVPPFVSQCMYIYHPPLENLDPHGQPVSVWEGRGRSNFRSKANITS